MANKNLIWILAVIGAILIFMPQMKKEAIGGEVAYYSFEAQDAHDDSNNGHDGTPTNGAAWTSESKVGNYAFQFDGIDDYISIPDNQDLDINGTLSLAAWIYPAVIAGDNRGIINKGQARGTQNQDYRITLNDKGHIEFVCGRGTPGGTEAGAVTGTVIINPAEWTHVAATYEAGIVRIYVNGILDTEGTGFVATPNDMPLAIGAEFDSLTATKNWFNGRIDDVRVYNNVLSDTEILELFEYPPTYDYVSFLNSKDSFLTGGELQYFIDEANQWII